MRRVVLLLSVLFTAAAPAQADLITVDFTGVITVVADDLTTFVFGVRVGDPVTGSVTYDTTTPDFNPSPLVGAYANTGTIELTSGRFAFLGGDPAFDSRTVVVSNQSNPIADAFAAFTLTRCCEEFAAVSFVDTLDGTKITSDALPHTLPNMTGVFSFGTNDLECCGFGGTVTTVPLTSVPLPSSILLVAAGLAALVGAFRRRNK